jgi:hypothetical protein
MVDYYAYYQNLSYSEFEKGAITGCLAYFINRPLNQVAFVRESLEKREKRLSRTEAAALIHRLDGLRGFYKF